MKKLLYVLSVCLICVGLVGCGSNKKKEGVIFEVDNRQLEVESSMPLKYAQNFTVDYYEEGYTLISINDTDYYIIPPDGDNHITYTCENAQIVNSELNNIYVVGTGSMDFFISAGGLEKVKFSSLPAEEWHIDVAKDAVLSGQITYAGKYSAPDYELLLNEGCDFIVENTMIYHAPEVFQQLQKLNFPVLVDYSIYEDSILGRMEWVKLYGLLTGKLEDAIQSFDEQEEIINGIENDSLDLSVGFFSITKAKTVSVRRSRDYVVNMIEMGGGNYAFTEILSDEGTGNTTIQMEAFYEMAKDCDVLIYNSTIEGELESLEDLINTSELLGKCKAVEDGRVYCTSSSFYQSAMELGSIVRDINKILKDEDDVTYFYKVK